MTTKDMDLLEEMRRELVRFQSGAIDVGDLGDRLLNLRDRLEFDDPEWYREVTDHIVTLDSASTFTPSSDAEGQQVRRAVSAAVDSISRLPGTKSAPS